MKLIAGAAMFAVYFVGPGVMTGLAVVKPRRCLWLAIIYLMGLEYYLWSPNFDVWILGHMPIGFSMAIGLYCGLLCTGRQHQDEDR